MIDLNGFLAIPFSYKGKCKIYPPTVRQILSDEMFPQYRRLLTISQEELEDEFTRAAKGNLKEAVPSVYDYLFINIKQDTRFAAVAKKAFEFFLHEEVNFLPEPKMVVIGSLEKEIKKAKSVEKLRLIKEDEFLEFQNAIRRSLGDKPLEPPNPNEHPRIKAMKAKARYRDYIKAKQGKGIDFGTLLVSICCMNMGLNPLNIGEISYASVKMLVDTYQEKEKYETEVRSLQAGADPKKIKPKYWIRQLDN